MEEHFETLMAGSVPENLFMIMDSKFDQRPNESGEVYEEDVETYRTNDGRRDNETYHHDDVHHVHHDVPQSEDDEHHSLQHEMETSVGGMKRVMDDMSMSADLGIISSPASPHKRMKLVEDRERSLLIRIRTLEHEVHKWKEMYEEERARRLEEQAHNAYPPMVSESVHLPSTTSVFDPPTIDVTEEDDEHSRDHEQVFSADVEDGHHQIISDVDVVTEEVEEHDENLLSEDTNEGEDSLHHHVPEVHHVLPSATPTRRRRKDMTLAAPIEELSEEEEMDDCDVDMTTIDNNSEENWMKIYSELEALYARKRRLPRLDYYHHPHLYLWINKQVERRERGELEERFAQMLTNLGFDWRKRRTLISWEEHYKKLTKVKEETGGFSLSNTKYHKNQTFFYWIRNQKRELKRGVVPVDRLEKLREIGFVDWVMSKLPSATEEELGLTVPTENNHTDNDPLRMTVDLDSLAPDLVEASMMPQIPARKFTKQELDKTPWRYWIPKLEEYKAKFGHLNPPFTNGEHHDLACWVYYLRAARKKNKPMPEHLIHQLDSMGFDWQLQETAQATTKKTKKTKTSKTKKEPQNTSSTTVMAASGPT